MSDLDEMTFGGHVYATREIAARARAEAQEAQQRVEEARARRAAEFEAALKVSFLGTPGATEDDWQRERGGILAEARKQAALAGDDAARRASAARYA